MSADRFPSTARSRRGLPLTLATGLALGALALFAACGGGGSGDGQRVIVLGFDGMDHGITADLMEQGKLPNISRLVEAGGTFAPLETSVPPLSPVAWSNFITGTDSGGHGIYDFFHRNPKTMIPEFSMSRVLPAGKEIELGKYKLALSGGGVELLRRGTAFWEVLEEHGVETTILRMPANFPPTNAGSRELTGMGTPDLLGGYGTFSFYTSVLFAFAGEEITGGEVYEVDAFDNVVRASLYGPPNTMLADAPTMKADFTVYIDPEEDAAKLVVGDEERLLIAGEWSDWVPVSFDLDLPTMSLGGIARFYLRRVRPEFELYVTPINIDPLAPAQQISFPEDYAAELAEATDRFYTQGMPEDTKAYTEEIFTAAEFLSQARMAQSEVVGQLDHVLDEFDDGLLFYYFSHLDLVSHVMYKQRDPSHPGHNPEEDAEYADVIEGLYLEADRIIGHVMERMGDDTKLIVMSDHGFAPWKRTFHLNTWLRDNGYLTAKDPNRTDDPGLFFNVDWSGTRAYGLGFNGLYLNQKGRERDGIVDPADRSALMRELKRKLLEVVDPETGEPVITEVYISEEWFTDRGALDVGPDMIVGYAEGSHVSDESALGELTAEVFENNMNRWSGDHAMDHREVPGVLLTNAPLVQEATSLKNLASAILVEFGIDTPFPPKSETAY